MSISTQVLPRTGHAREQLRQKGQFWTPDWVAEPMVAYALSNGSRLLFDPAVGEGAFLRAAKCVSKELSVHVALSGTEVDAYALTQALASGLSELDLSAVELRDFILNPPAGPFESIVANPPYIRHHRLSLELKTHLRQLAINTIGKPLDGRAGLHVYFLLQALQRLAPEGRLAFIVPADISEGVFAQTLWHWIISRFCLDAVVTFDSSASPFPQVDTNALIFLIRNSQPRERFLWARVKEFQTPTLKKWVVSGFADSEDGSSMTVCERSLPEGFATGFSRPQQLFHGQIGQEKKHVLGDFVRVMRGVATGANEFFFLTTAQAHALNLPDEFLQTAIGRTRDATELEITVDTLQRLESAGRPTRLLALDGRPPEAFSPAVQAYLRKGEQLGLPERPLIKQRRCWYKMESRRVPPFLFAYLGRRNARFIRNVAQVIPLTGFLCVYPIDHTSASVEKLWMLLRHPEIAANLHLVGKSYGSGAIKVEPRSLEKLPISENVLREVGMAPRELPKNLFEI